MSLNGYRLLIHAIFIRGSMAKELHHWISLCLPPVATDSLSTSVRTLRKVNGQGSATRITLRGIGSFALFFSSSSRRDSAALGSGSRHSLGGSDQRGGCPPPPRPFASFHEAEKRSRVPALILLSLSSVIPASIEAPMDGIPARSSLSISSRLFNSRTRAKRRTRRALRRTGHSTHWIIFTPSVQRVSLLLTTCSLLLASQMRRYFSIRCS